MKNKSETGREGERLAAEYLVRKGFEIVVRNYRHRRAEIDLIVKRDDWVIFVEVKTRSSTAFGEPEQFVQGVQVKKIFEAAEEFIFSTDWQGHVRFDVISVKLGREVVIDHFEDAIN